MTAPSLHLPHRPARLRISKPSGRAVARTVAVLRRPRFDDRPGIERNASLTELTMRAYPTIGGARF